MPLCDWWRKLPVRSTPGKTNPPPRNSIAIYWPKKIQLRETIDMLMCETSKIKQGKTIEGFICKHISVYIPLKSSVRMAWDIAYTFRSSHNYITLDLLIQKSHSLMNMSWWLAVELWLWNYMIGFTNVWAIYSQSVGKTKQNIMFLFHFVNRSTVGYMYTHPLKTFFFFFNRESGRMTLLRSLWSQEWCDQRVCQIKGIKLLINWVKISPCALDGVLECQHIIKAQRDTIKSCFKVYFNQYTQNTLHY